jgi:hypothetical protein
MAMTETDAFRVGPGNSADTLPSPGIPWSGLKG